MVARRPLTPIVTVRIRLLLPYKTLVFTRCAGIFMNKIIQYYFRIDTYFDTCSIFFSNHKKLRTGKKKVTKAVAFFIIKTT